MRGPRFDQFNPDLADVIPSGLGALQKGLCQQTGRGFFWGKQLEGKHLKMKHHWEGLLLCEFCFLQAKVKKRLPL